MLLRHGSQKQIILRAGVGVTANRGNQICRGTGTKWECQGNSGHRLKELWGLQHYLISSFDSANAYTKAQIPEDTCPRSLNQERIHSTKK